MIVAEEGNMVECSPYDVITVAFCWKYPSLQSYGYVRYGWFTVQRLANEIVVVSAEMEDRANALKLPLKFPGPAASGWTPPVPPVDYQRVYEDRYEEEWQDDCGQDWIDAIEIHGTTNVTFTGSSSTSNRVASRSRKQTNIDPILRQASRMSARIFGRFPQGDANLFMRIAVGMKSVSSGDLND